MKKLFDSILIYCGICVFVILIWQLLEIILLGYINPNTVDSIVGAVLTISLYYNYKNLQ